MSKHKTPGYYRKRTYAGQVMFMSDYFSGRMGKRGRGSPPRKKSTYEIQMAHWRRQKRELAILVNANFEAGKDQSLTLEWGKGDEKPPDKDAMQKEMQNFIKRLRRWYQKGHTVYRREPIRDKKGRPIRNEDGSVKTKRVIDAIYVPRPDPKYIYTMEIGPRGSRHVHMILSDVDLLEVTRCWQTGVPHGVVHGTALYEDGNYTELAEYYMKYTKPVKPEKGQEEETEGEKLGKRWYASQNLYRPEPITRKISEKTFAKDLPDVEGYHIDEDSIRGGGMETDLNGRPFRECIYIRNEKESYRPLRSGPGKRRKRRKK